jgi:integrase
MAAADYSGRIMRPVANLCERVPALGQNRGLGRPQRRPLVQVPRGPRAERHGLTVEQARSLLGAAREDRLGNLITVSLLLLGLRPGEAAALTWDGVHLDGPQPILRVERSLRRTAAGMRSPNPRHPPADEDSPCRQRQLSTAG